MKTLLGLKMVVLLFMAMVLGNNNSFAQSTTEKMEQRAKSMHIAITSNDVKVWESFVMENYGKKLLDRYEVSHHTNMIKRMNKDFGESKLVSINVKDNKITMVVEKISDKHPMSIILDADPKDDYKIIGLGVEAGDF